MTIEAELSEDEAKIVTLLAEKPREFAEIVCALGPGVRTDVLERLLCRLQDRGWVCRDEPWGNTLAAKYRRVVDGARS